MNINIEKTLAVCREELKRQLAEPEMADKIQQRRHEARLKVAEGALDMATETHECYPGDCPARTRAVTPDLMIAVALLGVKVVIA